MKVNHDIAAVFFICGNLSLLILPQLITGILFYSLLILLFLFLIMTCYFIKQSCWLCGVFFMLIGVLWSSEHAHRLQQQAIPFVDKKISVIAKAETLNIDSNSVIAPKPSYNLIRFSISQVDGIPLSKPLPIELTWKWSDKSVYAGQCWCLCLVTRAIHSRLNEGGFNAQRFSTSKGMLLRGVVKDAVLLEDKYNFRQLIVSNLVNKISQLSHADMILALLFGERQAIPKNKKNDLLYSGIAHLMAISGLHVILVAGLIMRFTQLLQYFLPTNFISPTPPKLLGFIVALIYVWLSGMNPPALRAITIFGAYLLLRIQGTEIGKGQLCIRLMALLILYNPLIVLSDSFWLSCLAALSLLFLYYWLPLPESIKNKWWLPFIQLLHLQIGIMLLLLPIQIILFNGISLGGILTNIIAVPLMSLFVMPLLMIGLFLFIFHLDMLAQTCYFLSNGLLDIVTWSAKYTATSWFITSNQYCYVAFIGWLIIIIFRTGLWRNFFCTVFLLFILIIAPFILKERYICRVDMLDVGHGLAIVIRQDNEAIIYDTGQNYGTSSEAEKQIIPFLDWHRLKPKLIILSHQHSDHSGGIADLKRKYPNIQLMSSSSALPNNFQCRQGTKWHWKKLEFEVIWPPTLVQYADNDDSCVIRVTDGKFSLLLTGDLERKQELKLIAKKFNIQSTIMQVPHHGSNTSSSDLFLKSIKPQLAINSASRYNPWHLPAKKVLSRYSELKIPVLATREQGQIRFYFHENYWQFAPFRQKIKPRWYHDWFGALKKYG